MADVSVAHVHCQRGAQRRGQLIGRAEVAPVSLPPHKFARLPCLYYRSGKVKTYEFDMASSGIILIPYFIRLRPAVLE
jgi:hypothetical protein